jgi:hypothetical protein
MSDQAIRAYLHPIASDLVLALSSLQKLVVDHTEWSFADFVSLVVEGMELDDAGQIPDYLFPDD